MSTLCNCNNESLEKTMTCFKCRSTWSEKMHHHERVASCPDEEHRMSISICGSTCPSLCQTCTDSGYSVQSEGGSWFPKYTVVKKN